jgi:DNA-binding PadR family transcriptional regulator
MVENIAKKFEKSMKKGFVNLFVLLVLSEHPSHGYQIKKLIEERTFGGWAPTDSTMYTILKDLRDKDLIVDSADQEPDDSRKIYELTDKGKKMLNVLKEKEEVMRESLNAIIFTTTEENDKFLDKSIYDFVLRGPAHGVANLSKEDSFKGPNFLHPMMGRQFDSLIERLKDKTPEKQVEMLTFQKQFITQQINRLTQHLNKIDKKISELKSEKLSNKK